MAAANKAVNVQWHPEVLTKGGIRALEYLGSQQWFKRSGWYLAGGTALALQVGHRTSVDLDFFTPQKEFSSLRLVSRFPENIWKVDILQEGTVYGRLFRTKVSFLAYPHFVPRYPFLWHNAVRVLDVRDIAVMKVVAISQRGKKRDFIDLYWCCLNREPLKVILHRLPQQFPAMGNQYHHILKSLTYFEDAEADPMPRLHFRAAWASIKTFFEKEVPRVTEEFLRLK